VSDPILLFVTIDAAALVLLGLCAAIVPLSAGTFLATLASGLGMLLCLPPLLLRAPASTLDLPVGPPGLALHLAFDPLAAFVLVIVFFAGTAVTAFQSAASPPCAPAELRDTALCLAGTALTLLAADGVSLAIGLAVMTAAISPQGHRAQLALLTPILLLAAICLLTPAGFAPRFDTIRTAPAEPTRSAIAAALGVAGVVILAGPRPAARSRFRDTLAAGMLIPAGLYVLLRVIADLAAGATQTGTGIVLLLAGGAIAVAEAWRAADHPDIDGSTACLTRRQAGLAVAGIGLALIARAADLPGAESFALAATLLAALGSGIAGVATTLATRAIGVSAGTIRLSRLGGLVHAMPMTAAALAGGLLGLAALPPGVGFAVLWLLFEALLSAPRTGGLLFQLPLALTGAAFALSAALATAAAVRLIGVALLGRPRTPQGAGAREARSPSRGILLALASLSGVAGVLPGLFLWLLAEPAIHGLTGAAPGARIGLALLLPSALAPSYLAFPVLALLALTTGAAIVVPRWVRKGSKPAGPWLDGLHPPVGLPFGEPAAQSAGHGFLPILPRLPLPRVPTLPALPRLRPPSATGAMWLLIAASSALLLLLACLA